MCWPEWILLVILGFIAVIDGRKKVIPDKILIALFVIGLLFTSNIIESIKGTLVGGTIPFVLALLTNGDGIGGGDIKTMAILGYWLGPKSIFMIITLTIMFSGVISFILILMGKKKFKDTTPLGPYIFITTFMILCVN